MNHEDAAALRGLVLRGVVHQVDDAGGLQTLDVETHAHVVRSGVEVLHPYGLGSAPPPGALTVVLAIGGDQGDLVALPAASPAGRMGGLQPGEVALYDDGGNRVHLAAGGTIRIVAATALHVVVGGTELRVAADGVHITGDLFVSGQVSDANGSMQEMRGRYNQHNHGGPPPSPLMD